jgi:hypothetical protein
VTIGYSINKPKDFHPKSNFLHFIGNYFRNLKVKSINASLQSMGYLHGISGQYT